MTVNVHWLIVKLSVGAVQTHGLQKPVLSSRNFYGCLENLIYNDLNLIDLAKKNNHQVSVMVGFYLSIRGTLLYIYNNIC